MHKYIYIYSAVDFSVAQMLKNLLAMQEIQVQPLDWEDPLEKGMAIHSTENRGGLQFVGLQRVGHD